MAEDWSAAAADVAEGLLEAGAAAVIVRLIPDPQGTPSDPGAPQETAHTVTAVVVDYSQREREGTSIVTGDRKALVSATGVTPTPQDRFRWEGADMQIVDVRRLAPAGVAVLFELQVRAS